MKTYKITLLGSEQSGKTCFLAGLGILSEGDRKSEFHLSSHGSSKQLIYELSSTLRSQKWPAGTSAYPQKFEGDLRYKGRDLNLNFIEYAGERFREAFSAGDELPEDLYYSIKDADYLLLALDPLVDFTNSVNLVNESSDAKNIFISRLDSLLECLHQIKLQRGDNPIKLGILIMKADQISMDISVPKQAELFMRDEASAFYERLKKDFPHSKVFGLSSVGLTERKDEEESIPAKHLEPWGYENLFDWIVSDIKTEKWKPIYKVIATCILIALIMWSGWVGYSSMEESTKFNEWQTLVRRGVEKEDILKAEQIASDLSLKNYRSIVDEQIKKGKSKLTDSHINRSDLMNHLNTVVALNRTKRIYRNQDLNLIVKKVKENLQKWDFDVAKRAYESGLDDFSTYAEDFINNYPNSRYNKTLLDWKNQKVQSNIKKDALQIYSMQANSLEAITNKAQAIFEFIQTYPNLPFTGDMKEASKQAMRLVNESRNNEFKVELNKLGTLTDDAYLSLKIQTDNNVVLQTKQSPILHVYSFESKKIYTFPWKPGNEIRITVSVEGNWGWFSGKYEAAEKIFTQQIALSKIDGKVILKTINDCDEYFKNEQALLECNVLNWEDTHWRLLLDWLSPGDKWLEIENDE